ncbi:MAG: antitoxin [Gemmatimonadota bacterium]
MTVRLQVLFEDDEMAQIREAAKRKRMTVAEWVRQELRRARQSEPPADQHRKLMAVREAAQYQYPVGDIDQMLGEIEHGYLSGGPE